MHAFSTFILLHLIKDDIPICLNTDQIIMVCSPSDKDKKTKKRIESTLVVTAHGTITVKETVAKIFELGIEAQKQLNSSAKPH